MSLLPLKPAAKKKLESDRGARNGWEYGRFAMSLTRVESLS